MTATEAQEELTLLRAARLKLLQGGIASYTINGRSVTYHSLKDLAEHEAKLEAVIKASTSGRRVLLGRFRGP